MKNGCLMNIKISNAPLFHFHCCSIDPGRLYNINIALDGVFYPEAPAGNPQAEPIELITEGTMTSVVIINLIIESLVIYVSCP